MSVLNLEDFDRRMQKTLDALRHEFAGLRTGRASTSMLDPVRVEVYGSPMPLNQCATVSVPEPRMLSVQVWDRNNVKAVEKAIRDSGLGLNPMAEGQTVRVPIPELNEQRRKELTKVASGYAEQARVAVRNIRRDAMDALKKAQKDGRASEDEVKGLEDKVQKLTDKNISAIDQALSQKQAEIMQV